MLPLVRKLGRFAAFCLVVASLMTGASAHPTQLSRLTLELAGADISGDLQVNAYDLGEALALPALADPQGRAVVDVTPALRAALGQFFARTLRVQAAGAVCPVTLRDLQPRATFIHVRLNWHCPSAAGALVLESRLFHAIDPAARLAVIVDSRAGTRQSLLDAGSPRWSLRQAEALATVFGRYVRAGIEHIFIGADHIAFLIGVILWGRRVWPLVATVTAFTLAHSLTLTLAVFDLVRIPSALVEAAIALSIVYVAIENFFVRDLAGRWRVTGLLGLVHGLGFASVLRDYGLPAEGFGWALGAFNLGVEFGQLAIVLGAIALLASLDRVMAGTREAPARSPAVVFLGSSLLGALGLYWFCARSGLIA